MPAPDDPGSPRPAPAGPSAWQRRRRFAFGSDLRWRVECELAAHLEHSVAELIAAGVDPAAAREEARRRFGDVERYREACCAIDSRRERRRRTFVLWSDLGRDLRLAARTLGHSPGFVAAALLTLALGLGANVAVFSVVYGMLLKPLPFPHPERLAMLWEKNPEKHWIHETASPANFLDWREPNRAFVDITGYLGNSPDMVAWTGSGRPQALRAAFVVGNFCSVLGVQPALGRSPRMDETWKGHRVALVSDAFWRQQLGADPHVLGRTLILADTPVPIVGVMPPGFSFPFSALDLWLTAGWDPAQKQAKSFRRAHNLRPIGRLRPGVSLAQAGGYLAATAARLERLYPDTNRLMGAGLTPLHEWWVGEQRPALLMLLGAVSLVLLIACVNVANLQLARAAARAREMAVRRALGAGRWRLIRQLLTESLLLALVAGGAGLLAAAWATPALLALGPQSLPRAAEIGLHPAVLAFAAVVTLLTAPLFGILPALSAARAGDAATLERQRGGTASRATARSREALTIAEVALATMLVIGAGLLLRSFQRIRYVDPGFRSDHVLVAELGLPFKRYKDSQAAAFYRRLAERAAALPGVAAAGLADGLPPTARGWTSDFRIAGRPPGEYGSEFRHRLVDPDYFRVLRVPLRRGRLFTRADDAKAPPVALVNEALARQYFGAADPVGHRIVIGREPKPDDTWMTIVGVVGDERMNGITAPVPPQIFENYPQDPDTDMLLILRTAGDPLALAGPVRAAVQALDPSLPLLSVATLDEMVDRSLTAERFLMVLMAAFGAIALALAAVGIGSVMSYSVIQRTREFGIRIALGAAAGAVLRGSVAGALLRAGLGIALGAAASLALSRLLRGLLFSTSPSDPATFLLVALCFLAVALAAAYLPARRVLGIDPALCLRHE